MLSTARVPAVANCAILLALLWARGDIAWVPGVSEAIGLFAVMFAPGLSAEPVFRTRRWTFIERFGLSAAMSATLTVLAGLGLHLVARPVTTTNIVSILLAASIALGALSLFRRRRSDGSSTHVSWGTETATAWASLILLVAVVAAILALRQPPGQPQLEAALVNNDGTLAAQPVRVPRDTKVFVNLAVRSPSRTISQTAVSIGGDTVQPWSTTATTDSGTWSIVSVPLLTWRSGSVHAVVTVHSDGADLRIPIELDVPP